MKRIGALIPSRMRSERLPGKALLPLADRPMIYHLLDRVVQCKYLNSPKDVVVCTTEDSSDDVLACAVENYGASVFRGDEHDIIARFAAAMEAYGFDAVVQADGDDPLSATEYMNVSMQTLLAEQSADCPAGIVTVSGLPLGCATKSFTREAMNVVSRAYQTRHNDTGFIYFFTRSALVRHVEVACTNASHQHHRARLTLDYDIDLELFETLFDQLYSKHTTFSLAELITYLHHHPELVALNLSVSEQYWKRTADRLKLNFIDADGHKRTISQ